MTREFHDLEAITTGVFYGDNESERRDLALRVEKIASMFFQKLNGWTQERNQTLRQNHEHVNTERLNLNIELNKFLVEVDTLKEFPQAHQVEFKNQLIDLILSKITQSSTRELRSLRSQIIELSAQKGVSCQREFISPFRNTTLSMKADNGNISYDLVFNPQKPTVERQLAAHASHSMRHTLDEEQEK